MPVRPFLPVIIHVFVVMHTKGDTARNLTVVTQAEIHVKMVQHVQISKMALLIVSIVRVYLDTWELSVKQILMNVAPVHVSMGFVWITSMLTHACVTQDLMAQTVMLPFQTYVPITHAKMVDHVNDLELNVKTTLVLVSLILLDETAQKMSLDHQVCQPLQCFL